jgi:hypothetical protein
MGPDQLLRGHPQKAGKGLITKGKISRQVSLVIAFAKIFQDRPKLFFGFGKDRLGLLKGPDFRFQFRKAPLKGFTLRHRFRHLLRIGHLVTLEGKIDYRRAGRPFLSTKAQVLPFFNFFQEKGDRSPFPQFRLEDIFFLTSIAKRFTYRSVEKRIPIKRI